MSQGRLKRLVDVSRAIGVQRQLRTHDRWTRARLEQHQRQRLSELLAHAVSRSPFYAQHLRGVVKDGQAKLADLPVLTKATMMNELDRLVTDQRLRRADLSSYVLSSYVEKMTWDDYYLGEYRVLATSGSSGQKGIFVYNRRDWSTALGTVLRWGEFMGVHARLFPRRVRVCSIGGESPTHGTFRVAASLNVGLYRVLRLQASSRVPDLVGALNEFQPDVINAYPSIAALLAVEQIEGRLRIHPRAVSTSSEVRTAEMERRMREAWGIAPFNRYGMTEVASFGSECSEHRGIHAFEDMFLFEVVDDDYRPVPDGTAGRKLLITNLFNYTQPLIRYEVSDMLTVTSEPCPCGRPLRLVTGIEGRSDDILYLPDAYGKPVPVHPVHFWSAIDAVPDVKDFQVVQEPDGIHVRAVLRQSAVREPVTRRIAEELTRRLGVLGAVVTSPIQVEVTGEIARDAKRMGKHKVVLSNVPRSPPGPPS
jgi:phenylacetate-coenzyme A ligase PaaK-like adenylate-forming protein